MGSMISIPFSVYMITQNPVIGLGTLLGYGLEFFFDPDLDQYASTGSESRLVKYIPFVGNILYGYSCIFGAFSRGHHRGILSHGIFIGALVRLVYLFWWLVFLYWKGITRFEIWQLYFFVGLFLGYSLADSFHIFADMIGRAHV